MRVRFARNLKKGSQAVRAAEGHSAPVQGRSMEGDPGVAEMVVVEESEALVPVSRQQVQGDLRAEAVASAQLPPEASPPPEQLLELTTDNALWLFR